MTFAVIRHSLSGDHSAYGTRNPSPAIFFVCFLFLIISEVLYKTQLILITPRSELSNFLLFSWKTEVIWSRCLSLTRHFIPHFLHFPNPLVSLSLQHSPFIKLHELICEPSAPEFLPTINVLISCTFQPFLHSLDYDKSLQNPSSGLHIPYLACHYISFFPGYYSFCKWIIELKMAFMFLKHRITPHSRIFFLVCIHWDNLQMLFHHINIWGLL